MSSQIDDSYELYFSGLFWSFLTILGHLRVEHGHFGDFIHAIPWEICAKCDHIYSPQ